MQYIKKKSPELAEQAVPKQNQQTEKPVTTAYSTTNKPFKDLRKESLETPIVSKNEQTTAPVVTEPIHEKPTEIEPISTESIQHSWNQFVKSIKTDAQLSAIASHLQPTIVDNDIRFTVQSAPEKSTFEQQIRAIFLQFLKQQFPTAQFSILIDIVAETYTTKPSNNAEKYEYLVKQNPFLQTMKDSFNLEIE